MNPPRRKFEVDLIPKGAGKMRHFSFSFKQIWGGIFLVILSIAGWVLLFNTLPMLKELWVNPVISVLEKENRSLQTSLDQLSYQTATMTSQLNQIQQQLARVSGLASTSALPSSIARRKVKNSKEALKIAQKLSALSHQTHLLFGNLENVSRRLPLAPPFRHRHTISLTFGAQLDPFTGKRMMHEGVDFPGAVGDTIVAPADGYIQFPTLPRGFGSALQIDHGEGITTTYTHLERALISSRKRVVQGQPIALLGNSGRSSAPHLHYEVRRNSIPIDPLLLFLDRQILLSSSAPGVKL